MDKSLISLSDRRPLAIALAHCMVVCRPGRDIARLLILNRIHDGNSFAQQLQTRAELQRCRQAVRGELLAVVS